MHGGKNRQPLGYTIIEVMIVLAVSAVMFVIAATFISGKQARTAFTVGTNELTTQLQSIITQVNDGQYSDVNFKCQTNPAVGKTITIISDAPSSSSNQGTNASCIFIAKLLQFNYSADKTKYAVFSMAGQRGIVGYPTSLDATTPIMTAGPPPVDLTLYDNVPQGLDVISVTIAGIAGQYHSIGFAQSVGSVTNNVYDTSAQTTGLVYTDDSLTMGAIVALSPTQAATICVTDGQRYAQITLGDSAASSSQLSATLKVVAVCS